MSVIDKNTLVTWFVRQAKPLASQFAAWLDSYWHKWDDIPIASIFGLSDLLKDKADKSDIDAVNSELEKKADKTDVTNFKGYHPTLEALLIAYPQAETVKDWYAFCGSPGLGNIYKVYANGGAWTDTGIAAPSVDVDMSEYAKNGGSPLTMAQMDEKKNGFVYTNKALINMFIKELYLQGVDYSKAYRIDRVYRNRLNSTSSREWIIDIKDSSNITVTSFVSLNTSPEDTPILPLSSANSSGVSGYIVVDWMAVSEASTSINALINNYAFYRKFNPLIDAYLNRVSINKFVYSDDEHVNNIIKELYLQGVDDRKSYYISRIFNGLINSSGKREWLIDIYNSDNQNVSRFVSNFNPSDKSVISLSERGSSGVSGYIVVDWNRMKDTSIAVKATLNNLSYKISCNPFINQYISSSHSSKRDYNVGLPRWAKMEITASDWPWAENKIKHSISIRYSDNTGRLEEEVGMASYQGSSTMAYAKKNFRIIFDSLKKYGNWAAMSQYNLKAYWTDITMLREPVCNIVAYMINESLPFEKQYPWSGKTVIPTGARGICDFFPCELHINGQFHGYYMMGLSKDGNNYSVNESNQDHFAIEGLQNGVSDFWSVFNDSNWEDIAGNWDEVAKGNFASFLSFLATSSDSDFYNNLPFKENWIDYYIMMELFMLNDNAAKNMTAVSLDRGNSICPFVYDMDRSFGYGQTNAISSVLTQSQSVDVSIWTKLYRVFKNEIEARFKELYDSGIITYETIQGIFMSLNGGVPYSIYLQEKGKWPGKYNAPSYNADLAALLRWYKARISWAREYFNY